MLTNNHCCSFVGLTAVSASSVHAAAFPPVNAFDGYAGSFWHSISEQNPWLKADLGEMYGIVGAEFTSRSSGGGNGYHLTSDLSYCDALLEQPD